MARRAPQVAFCNAEPLLACRGGGGASWAAGRAEAVPCVALRVLGGCSTAEHVVEEASKALSAGEAPLPVVAASPPPAARSANGSVLHALRLYPDRCMHAHPSSPNSYIIGISGKRAETGKGRAVQSEVVEAPCMLDGSSLF